FVCVALLVCAGICDWRVAAAGKAPAGTIRQHPTLRGLPLMFERNEGQADGSVRFLSRGADYTLFLAADETVLSLGRADVRMRLVGANARPAVTGEQELPTRVNYFIGKDPAKWQRGVRTYAKVRE